MQADETQAAIDSPQPSISHDEVMTRMNAKIVALLAKAKEAGIYPLLPEERQQASALTVGREWPDDKD